MLNQIPINPTNVGVGSVLTMQITYANIDILPPDAVIFTDLTNAPDGATISSSGVFRWQPNANQVTSGTNITVWAYEQLQPANIASLTFTVVVTNAVTPVNAPVLGPIPNQTVNAGETLQFYLYATNTDNTTNLITFTPAPNPATSATITNGTMSVIKTATTTNGASRACLTGQRHLTTPASTP